MTTPANVLHFFAEAHWGSRYGVTDEFHRTPHKGLDVGLFHGIVDVPALHDGTVVAASENSLVGHYVTIKRADDLFDTYCHIVPVMKVGQVVKQGTPLGRQAVTQAEGGLQWQGQHTHLCLSRTQGGWGVWGYVNLDPTPGVIAVLTNTASAGGTPIDNTTQQLEEKMDTRYFKMAGSDDWSRIGATVLPVGTFPGGYEATADVNVARAWGNQYGGEGAAPIELPRELYVKQQQFGAQEYTLHQASLAKLIASSSSGAGTVNLQPILDAIAALDKQADDYQAQLGAILAKGLTISGTAVPKA